MASVDIEIIVLVKMLSVCIINDWLSRDYYVLKWIPVLIWSVAERQYYSLSAPVLTRNFGTNMREDARQDISPYGFLGVTNLTPVLREKPWFVCSFHPYVMCVFSVYFPVEIIRKWITNFGRINAYEIADRVWTKRYSYFEFLHTLWMQLHLLEAWKMASSIWRWKTPFVSRMTVRCSGNVRWIIEDPGSRRARTSEAKTIININDDETTWLIAFQRDGGGLPILLEWKWCQSGIKWYIYRW